MKNIIIRFAVTAFSAMIFVMTASEKCFAQNSISGIIFDENRRPVAEIEIELLDEFERLIKSAKTRGSGLYMFQGLRAGIYYVQVRTAGTNFRQAKERVQLGQTNRVSRTTGSISGSEALQVNLTLQYNSRGENKLLYNEVVFAQNVPSEAEKYFQNALKNFEKNNANEAVAELLRAIEIFPEYFLALDRLGYEYLVQEKFEEAENVFGKAVRVNPKSFSSQYGLGAARFSRKKFAEAADALEQAAVLNPSSVNSYFLLGRVKRELKEYEKAEINLKKANELSEEKLPDIHWELALLYYHNLKRYNEAADELELYLKANPKAENKEQVKKLIKIFRSKAKEEKSSS